jgi:predicted Fe-Mo cluster-binding NifX family protein
MKIAVSSAGDNLNAPFDDRLEHTPHVVILDSKNLHYKDLRILNREEPPSDEVIARTLIKNQVDVVVTGECSGILTDMLDDAHIRLFDGMEGSVRDNVLALYRKKLSPKLSPHYSIDESETMPPAEPTEEELWEVIPGHIPDEKREL